ncbi:MAG: hypothetical protein AAGJ93_09360 [Bacteroidota bacterium]
MDCGARLCNLYRHKELERHAAASQRQLEQLLQQSSIRSSSHQQFYHHLIRERNLLASKQQRTAVLQLQEQSMALDMTFLLTKLKEGCELLSHQTVVRTNYDLGFLPAILPSIQDEMLEIYPIVGLWLDCFRMLKTKNNPAYFYALCTHLQQTGHWLPLDERRDAYLFAINFSIRRFNEGETTFGREAFELYRKVLQQGLLTLDGYLSRFAYRNIVALSLQLKEFDWIENFLSEYRNQLSPNYQLATYSFNLAKLEYARGQLDGVILALQKADYRDVLLNLAAKTLLVKVYYEQQALQALDSHLAAMRRFLRRKKMIAYHRDNYLHFVQAVQQLLRLNPYDKAAVISFQQHLMTLQPLTERQWLLDQLSSNDKH